MSKKPIITACVTILLLCCLALATTSAATNPEPSFNYGHSSNWTGAYPIAGDSIFYVEVQGTNLDELVAEAATWNDPVYTVVAHQTNRWYLGKTATGDDRYIYEMKVEASGKLVVSTVVYIRLRNDSGSTYYDNNACFTVNSGYSPFLSSDMPQEITSSTTTVPFEIRVDDAASDFSKDTISVELWSGTSTGMFEAITESDLVGTADADAYEIAVAGGGQYLLSGSFTVTAVPPAGATLFAKISYENTAAYTSAPVYVVSAAGLGQFTMTNAIAARTSGPMEGQSDAYLAADGTAFYLSSTGNATAHKFCLTGGTELNASLITVTDNVGTNVLRAGTIAVTGPVNGIYTASGTLDIPNGAVSITIGYNGSSIYSCPVMRSTVVGAAGLSCDGEYNALKMMSAYPADTTSFVVSLSGINLPSEGYSATIDDNAVGCSVQSADGELKLEITSSIPLNSSHSVEILRNGASIPLLRFNGTSVYEYMQQVSRTYLFGDLIYTVFGTVIPPALTEIGGNRALNLYGQGFTSDAVYTAYFMEHTAGGLSAVPQQLTATYVSSTKLTISDALTDTLARGWYEVYLKANGTQINGFADVALMPAAGADVVINPAVSVSGGAAYTFSQSVPVAMTAGTFSEVRYSENQAELSTLAYAAIPTSATVHLSSGYGNKTIYFDFRAAGGNMYSTTASIRYRAGAAAAPSACGAAGQAGEQPLLLYCNQSYTVYLQASGSGNVGKLKLLDSSDSVISTETLNRTAGTEASYTYSKLLNFNNTAVEKLRFYFTDSDGVDSEHTDVDVNVSNAPYILSYRSDISTEYLGRQYAKNGSAIRCTIYGRAGYDGSVTLHYLDGASAPKTASAALSGSGTYTGSVTIPSDAASLSSIEYRLEETGLPANFVTKTELRELPVTSSLTLSALPNDSGEFNGKYIRIYCAGGYSSKTMLIGAGQTSFTFDAIKEGEYTYYVTDSDASYISGTVSVAAGQTNTASLDTALKPAVLTFNVGGGVVDSNAYISYRYSVSGQEYLGYAKPAKAIKLHEGVSILSYELVLSHSDIRSYTVPPAVAVPFALTAGANSKTIALTALSKVSLTITAQDSSIPGRVIPGAAVTVNQTVTNGSRTFWYNASATTDSAGQCTLQVYPSGDTSISAKKEDYKNIDQDITVTDTATQSAPLPLEYGTLNRVKVNWYTQPLLEDGEAYDPSKRLETGNGAGYAYARDAAGGEISYYYDMTSGILVFSNDMSDQTVRIYPKFYLPRYAQQEYYTLTLDGHGNGSVDVIGSTGGVITADVAVGGNNPPASYMMVYDSAGRRSVSIPGSTHLSTSTGRLSAGTYTVMVFSGYELTKLDALSSLEAFDSLSLQQNVHYSKYSVTLENGKTKHLGTVALPSLVTDSMLSAFTVRIEGTYVQGAANGTGGKVYVKARIIPSELLTTENLSIQSINVFGDNSSAASEKAYNGVVSSLGNGTYLPNADGNYVVTYRANCTPNKVINTMSVQLRYSLNGSSKLAVFRQDIDTPVISIILPTTVPTPASAVSVRGIAYAGSTVEIFEGETLIGSTVANEYHSYNLLLSLLSPKKKGTHEIYARQTLTGGETFTTSPATVSVVERQQGVYIGDYEFINTAHANGLNDANVRRFTLDSTGRANNSYYTYSPYGMSRVTFTIYNLVSTQLEDVCIINTYNGEKTRYPATLITDEESGAHSKWKVETNFGQKIGNLSIFYSLKNGEDLGQLTGATAPTQIDFNNSLNNLGQIDPATIPESVRTSSAATITQQTSTSLKAHKQFGDGEIGIEIGYSSVSGISEAALIASGYLKIPVGSSGEYYLIKDSSTTSGFDLTVRRTMYLSSGLADTLTENGGLLGFSPEASFSTDEILLAAYPKKLNVLSGKSLVAGVTVRDIAGKVDYIGYLENMGEITYEAFRGTANLGKLGTGMQVLGGAATATQVFMGPASLDPALLKEAVGKIQDATVRSRLSDEIYEYQYARRDSHTISSLMGVVSYSSSFFSLPGKCLSYIVSTGGMIYSSEIDSEYNLWGNSILQQIIMQLRIEEKDAGKEDDLDDPKWIMDPSGYVFEAIDSQRVSGITATAQTDNSGSWGAWNDESLTMSGQVNPQTTTGEGRYGWDVPFGDWRVLFEDASGNYQTAVTNAMSVPPAHTEVNIGLLSTTAPAVTAITVDPSGLEIEFSRYMQAESIYDSTSGVLNVQVYETVGGSSVPCGSISGLISAANTGYTSGGIYQNDVITSGTFVKRIRFNADETLYPSGFKLFEDDGITSKKYNVTVSGNVLSYAGVPMGSDYSLNNITAAARQTAAEPSPNIAAGTYVSAQTVSLTTSTPGATIYYTTNGAAPTATSAKYEGPITVTSTSTIKAFASKTGMDSSSVLTVQYVIDDGSGPLIVATPASSPSGGTFTGSVSATLSTATPGAVIYYTLDGSVPTTSSNQYTTPISISATSVLKAIGIKGGYANSGVLTAFFTIIPQTDGDDSSDTGTNKEPLKNGEGTIVFSDVPDDHWAQDAIQFVTQRGLFEGTGNEQFSPSDHTTRGMLITVLWRLENKPGMDADGIFSDVPSGEYYAQAVLWAGANEIVKGNEENQYRPMDNITREQIALILFNYAKNKGYDISASSALDSFKDGENTSPWAENAMRWAVEKGLIQGKGSGILDPSAYANRAEIAIIFMRFIDTVLD